MLQSLLLTFSVFISLLNGKPVESAGSINTVAVDSLRYPQEKHLANLTQLTFGGDNAEAYWSFDSHKLTFQATRAAWHASCDQIFMIDITQPLDTFNIPP